MCVCVCVYVYGGDYAVQKKLAQHCKSTTLKKKKKKKKPASPLGKKRQGKVEPDLVKDAGYLSFRQVLGQDGGLADGSKFTVLSH